MIAVVGIAASVLWLWLAADYIGEQIGWDNLFFLLPHEIAIFVAGVFAPLAFLWLVLLYLAVGRRLAVTRDLLAARLDALTYPAEDAETRVAQVSAALRAQAQDLSAASDAAIAAGLKLETMLGRQAGALNEVAGRLASQVGETDVSPPSAKPPACTTLPT